jgi:hypothetical protein
LLQSASPREALDFELVIGVEMSFELNCSNCSLLRLHRVIRSHLDNDLIIRLQSRFYHPQSIGELPRRYMPQPGDILGIHDVHETLVLIRANRPISHQERVVFGARGNSHPDKVSWRQKPIGVRK